MPKGVSAALVKRDAAKQQAYNVRDTQKVHKNNLADQNVQVLKSGTSYMKHHALGDDDERIARYLKPIQANTNTVVADSDSEEEMTKTIAVYESILADPSCFVLTNIPAYIEESDEDEKARKKIKKQKKIKRQHELGIFAEQKLGGDDNEKSSNSKGKKKSKNKDSKLTSNKSEINKSAIVYKDKEEEAFYDSIRDRKFIISYNAKARFYWDLVVIIGAIYNSFSLPLQLSFPQVDQMYKESTGLAFFELTIDFLFAIDIVIGFLSSYVNRQSGDEIKSPKLIAIHYIRTDFIIDFLSTFPFGDLYSIVPEEDQNSTIMGAFLLIKLLKIIRIRKISKMIVNLTLAQESKASLKLIFIVFTLVLYIHVIACLLWFIFSLEQMWVPPLDFIFVGTTLYEQNFVYQYATALYHSALVFGLVEIGPMMTTEIAAVAAIMLISAMFNANIFGSFSVLSEQMNKKAISFQDEFDTANTAMKNLNLQTELVTDVRKFILETQVSKDNQDEMKEFMGSVSNSVRQLVISIIFTKVLNVTPLFEDIKDNMQKEETRQRAKNAMLQVKTIKELDIDLMNAKLLELVVSKLQLNYVSPEERVVRQGEREADQMFFILNGEQKVKISSQSAAVIDKGFEKTLTKGMFFGEIALIYGGNRTASVMATNYTTLGVLTKKDLSSCYEVFPILQKALIAHSLLYDDPLKLFLVASLRTIPYLTESPEEILIELAFTMKPESLEPGSTIFHSNDPATFMFIIMNGVIEIMTTMDSKTDFVIERLSRGSAINPIGFLIEDSIDVSGRVVSNTSVYLIKNADFFKIVQKDMGTLNRVQQTIVQSLANNDNPVSLDYTYGDTNLKHPKGHYISPINKIRFFNSLLKLKNTIMYFITKNRETRKVPKLKDILAAAIKKQQEEQTNKRNRKKAFTLDDLNAKDTYLTPEQYVAIQEQAAKLDQVIETGEYQINLIKKKIDYLLRRPDLS